jgi:PIN domain nuclease of toxin-antitoxin system
MAIKLSIGKLTLQMPLADIVAQLNVNGFDLLPISSPHVLTQ